MRRRQSHCDRRIAVLGDIDVVDEPKLVDVDWNFRIVDRLQDFDDCGLKVASRTASRLLLLLSGEKPRKIVALAGDALWHASARRRRHRANLFSLNFALFVHTPKIRLTCSIPFTSAAMSEASLWAAKLALAVASRPSHRIRGWAQW